MEPRQMSPEEADFIANMTPQQRSAYDRVQAIRAQEAEEKMKGFEQNAPT
jgi:hypothetical protein